MDNALRAALGVVVAALLALAGCAVGPDYQQRPPATDAGFVSAGAISVNSNAPSSDIADFWRLFNDPALTQLVERALGANGDIRVAEGRLRESRAIRTGTNADLLPEIDLSAAAERALAPSYLFPGTTRSQRQASVFDGNFVANWELDFFGRNRRADEAAGAQVQASEAGVHAAQTAIAAEVARNYLDLRGLQERYTVATRSLESQRQTLKLTRARLDAGRGSQLDVARSLSLFESTEASIPLLQASMERDAFRLATLSAQAPRDVSATLSTSQPLPSLPVTDLSALPIGTPEQMLRRRPDLIVAERQLAASTAEIGVATADLFPRISLTGLIGIASARIGDLGSSGSEQYSLGAGLIWPLLDFGRVRARIEGSRARSDQALARYEQTVALALEETEGALSQFTRFAQQAERLERAATSADEATRLSQLRFDAGSVDLLAVLDAERQALAIHDSLAQAQTGQAIGLVNVYRTLGGGWSAWGTVARAEIPQTR